MPSFRAVPAGAVLLTFFAVVIPAFATTILYDGAVPQTYTVATTGIYSITAFGATGGSPVAFGSPGGNGAEIGGQFALNAGTALSLYVGGVGGNGIFDGAGGGGTFVIGAVGNPMLVAGGGGGGGGESPGQSGKAEASNSHGGSASEHSGGGGGFSSGGGSAGLLLATGGAGYPGLAGGMATIAGTNGGDGGFGGGGGSGNGEGGGGGGYSGGDAGSFENGGGGIGGGSFDAGTNQILIAGENAGYGFVDITFLAFPAPEPAPLALTGAGLFGLAVLSYRRFNGSHATISL